MGFATPIRSGDIDLREGSMMSARRAVIAAAAETTEQAFKEYLDALTASHQQIHVTRSEDILHGKVEIKITAVAKNKRVAA